ncbi:uncharacterized protein LOC116200886 isoform X2 [Punica granatum]|uniref:Uncharacterized protein LOC116200886 isoform X2 n=1 Tax=Punica granatum TaxID=22663 RepID=A0A6P8D239_PUNGR|nr:uncharacterized protein LOC116200886 isoform X2 [Punica granatum]
MPGTIQISVSDIVDLPPSSTPPSWTSIRGSTLIVSLFFFCSFFICLDALSLSDVCGFKLRNAVTMGRREYQASENGDLSIPLTTLRENLVVKLLNSNGHEISCTVVETRLVVEKGIWDEIFHLEGGGKMHLKMQFVLSEEEQSRIRMMRLSALKKKHGDLINDSSKGPDKATDIGRDAATALLCTRGVSVSRQKAEASAAESESTEVLDKREKISPPEAATRRGLHGEKASSSTSVSKPPATFAKSFMISHSKAEQGAARNTETKGMQEKTPSNVRKMISAFETSLAQDKRPRIKPPPTKPKLTKNEMEVLPSNEQSKERATAVCSIDSLQNQHSAVHEKAGRVEETESAIISGRTLSGEPRDGRQSWKAQALSSDKNEEMKLLSYHGNMEDYSSEGSRQWMFLDEPSNFCVTTGGKKMMHLMEGQMIRTGNCQEKKSIMTPNTLEKLVGVVSRSDIEMNNREQDKASASRQRKPESSRKADADPSGGPLGQVMKIAIMVGFGALVLFTRQGMNR